MLLICKSTSWLKEPPWLKLRFSPIPSHPCNQQRPNENQPTNQRGIFRDVTPLSSIQAAACFVHDHHQTVRSLWISLHEVEGTRLSQDQKPILPSYHVPRIKGRKKHLDRRRRKRILSWSYDKRQIRGPVDLCCSLDESSRCRWVCVPSASRISTRCIPCTTRSIIYVYCTQGDCRCLGGRSWEISWMNSEVPRSFDGSPVSICGTGASTRQ